jgi:cytochrome c55X
VALACALGTVLADDELAPARRAELTRLVRQDCGACHGGTLKGGLGPPLVAAALGDKSAAYLKYTILYGRPGTPMPPWRAFLTEADAEWIAARLLEGFPDAR